MRGAGKTFIGKIAAEVLGGGYTDADDVFQEYTKMSVSAYVDAHDWIAFRKTETDLLKRFMTKKRDVNHVIGLGGGIVETEEARNLLCRYIADGGIVVHVSREAEAIEGYLNSIGNTALRPNWGEAFVDVYTRRAPWFRECSNYQFYNSLVPALLRQSSLDHYQAIRKECARYFGFISGISENRPDLRASNPTSFLSLTFLDVQPVLDQIPELVEGVDAIELRVDLLCPGGTMRRNPELPPLDYVEKQLSMLRLVTNLPIVYSVRSKDQGGMASSDNSNAYLEMIELGLRSGCEYVDLEMAWPSTLLDTVKAVKRHSHIIASWHDWSGNMDWGSSETRTKFDLCGKYGDVVKLVGMAKTFGDNAALSLFAQQVSGPKPLLAINMGPLGQLSRISNLSLTPVTHHLLPSRAAPGQLTIREINQGRSLIGLLPPKKFFLFGSPITHSVSPPLHNSGFSALGLPHVYSLMDTIEPTQSVLDCMRDPHFGGASVTIPLKIRMMDHLGSISEDARIIGAINTIISRNGKLHGENTDWQAIHEAASQNLPYTSRSLTGLVIGAGGTCRAAIYALHKLGASEIILYNRTLENAQRVKDEFPTQFNITVVNSLSSSVMSSAPAVVISTIPGDSLTTHDQGEGIYLDPVVLGSETGVAIDMAYKPHMTALLRLAGEMKGWKAIPGIEILCLQGFKQFGLWTGKQVPTVKMRRTVMEKYFGKP